MSRIHEALKKAELERTNGADGTAVRAAEVPDTGPAEESLPALSVEPRLQPPMEAPQTAAQHTAFDDLRRKCVQREWKPDPQMNVFVRPDSNSVAAEQFRTLRSRLYQFRSHNALKTILVTSAVPGEGKTFVATNLAQAIVRQPDRRVLLMDADLRCARLHLPLGAPVSPGLSDYLKGGMEEFSIIHGSPYSNLCLIPAGSDVTNPNELLSGNRLKELLEQMAGIFDWVVLDSPPVIPVADATILAECCDGVVVVVRAGSTPLEMSRKVCQELRNRNVLGVVLNQADKNWHDGTYYGGYYTDEGDRKNAKG